MKYFSLFLYEGERERKKNESSLFLLSILLSVVVFVVLPILRDILRLFLFFFLLLVLLPFYFTPIA